MAISDKLSSEAIMAARNNTVGLENLRVSNVVPNVLGGSLVTVTGSNGGHPKQTFVLVQDNSAQVYSSIEEFARAVAHGEPKKELLYQRVLADAGIPGVLALIITGAIAYIAVYRGESQIPMVLSSGFATILGFYFGTTVVKARGKLHNESDAHAR